MEYFMWILRKRLVSAFFHVFQFRQFSLEDVSAKTNGKKRVAEQYMWCVYWYNMLFLPFYFVFPLNSSRKMCKRYSESTKMFHFRSFQLFRVTQFSSSIHIVLCHMLPQCHLFYYNWSNPFRSFSCFFLSRMTTHLSAMCV